MRRMLVCAVFMIYFGANKANGLAGALSGGQQKLLSMGALLMGDPTVLLLDEPAAGSTRR